MPFFGNGFKPEPKSISSPVFLTLAWHPPNPVSNPNQTSLFSPVLDQAPTGVCRRVKSRVSISAVGWRPWDDEQMGM